jgi:Clustered mitochondria/FYVE zinc finger/Translation initiation factor eIF3 subunit 135/Ankyrin repeats (3 copies)/Ankyrin repeat
MATLEQKHQQALTLACARADADAARIAVESGADVNMVMRTGWTPLTLATMKGAVDVVNVLLELKADINLVSTKHAGNGPLHLAVKWKRVQLIRELILRGADTELKNTAGNTPIELCKFKKRREQYDAIIAKAIADRPADIAAAFPSQTPATSSSPTPTTPTPTPTPTATAAATSPDTASEQNDTKQSQVADPVPVQPQFESARIQPDTLEYSNMEYADMYGTYMGLEDIDDDGPALATQSSLTDFGELSAFEKYEGYSGYADIDVNYAYSNAEADAATASRLEQNATSPQTHSRSVRSSMPIISPAAMITAGKHNKGGHHRQPSDHLISQSTRMSDPVAPQLVRMASVRPTIRGKPVIHDLAMELWVPDDMRRFCASCNNKFTRWRRRHHCRVCGEIFCNACSSKRLPSALQPEKELRVCIKCFANEMKAARAGLAVAHPDVVASSGRAGALSSSSSSSSLSSSSAAASATSALASSSNNDQKLDISEPLYRCNWNDAYQRAIENEWQHQDPSDPLYQSKQLKLVTMAATRQLVVHFTQEACRIARIIVDELDKPVAEKSIHPVDVGGVAGGQKYVVNHIFIKFVADFDGIYGGDYFAQKAAGHELKGLLAYREAGIAGISTALMNMVNYGGYRLLACSCIPIGADTLVYGSNDAGRSIHRDDTKFNELMEEAAKFLNIKPHVVGRQINVRHELAAPVDIEGHIDTTEAKRRYVLDTARVFPPERPLQTHLAVVIPAKPFGLQRYTWTMTTVASKVQSILKSTRVQAVRMDKKGLVMFYTREHDASAEPNPRAQQILYNAECAEDKKSLPSNVCGDVVVVGILEKARHLIRLLRPEFVRKYKKALSSDAYTWFGLHNHKEHNAEVSEATDVLLGQCIGDFVKRLENFELHPASGASLTEMMHSAGINVRYMGLIRSKLSKAHPARSIFLTEMITRVAKTQLRFRLRLALARYKDHGILHDVAAEYFNLVFGSSVESGYFWKTELKLLLQLKFASYGPLWGDYDAETHPDTDLRPFIQKASLFRALQLQTGVKFRSSMIQRVFGSPYDLKAVPFTSKDIAIIHCTENMVSRNDKLIIDRFLAVYDLTVQAPGSGDEKSLTSLIPSADTAAVQQWTEVANHAEQLFGGVSCVRAAALLQVAMLQPDPSAAVATATAAFEVLSVPAYDVLNIPVDIYVSVLNTMGRMHLATGAWRNALDFFHQALSSLENEYGRGMETYVTDLRDIYVTGSNYVAPVASCRPSQPEKETPGALAAMRAAQAAMRANRTPETVAEFKVANKAYSAAREADRAAQRRFNAALTHAKPKTRENVKSLHPFATVLANSILTCLWKLGSMKEAKTAAEKYSQYSLLEPLPPNPEIVSMLCHGQSVPLGAEFSVHIRAGPTAAAPPGVATPDARAKFMNNMKMAWERKKRTEVAWLRTIAPFYLPAQAILSAPFDAGVLAVPAVNGMFLKDSALAAQLQRTKKLLPTKLKAWRSAWQQYYADVKNVNKTKPMCTTSEIRQALRW